MSCSINSDIISKFEIHNVNKGYTLDKDISLKQLLRLFLSEGIKASIIKEKAETLNCLFYFSEKKEKIFCKNEDDYIPIKIQIFISSGNKLKIKFTTKFPKFDPVQYINKIINSASKEDFEEEMNTKKCTLLELFELI